MGQEIVNIFLLCIHLLLCLVARILKVYMLQSLYYRKSLHVNMLSASENNRPIDSSVTVFA